MGGSTADSPTTPEFGRASDAERDHAVSELRHDFVEGRLSHETFMYRMQSALGARSRRQLAELFTDLPSRRPPLLARFRAALRTAPPRTEPPRTAPPLVFPPGRGTHFLIGRTRDCDLFIADLSVSRTHAELVRGEDGWLLGDLGSRNGTRLNGWLIREPVPVRAGDQVTFGTAPFVISGDPRPEPPGTGRRTD